MLDSTITTDQYSKPEGYILDWYGTVLVGDILGGDPLRMNTFMKPYGKATSIGLTDDVSVYDAVIILIVNTIDIPNPNRQLIYGPSSIPFIVGGHYYAGVANGDGTFTFHNGSTFDKRTNTIQAEFSQLRSSGEKLINIWGIKY